MTGGVQGQTKSATQAHAGDGDQRESGEGNQPTRYQEGVENAHNPLDSKDQRTIANRLAAAEKEDHQRVPSDHEPPTAAAKSHGNEPSRGAEIDESIENDEKEYLERKGKA